MKNTILYLIGFPGTGKYTIAKAICSMEHHFRLVDSHLINNPLFSLIDMDGKTKIPKGVWHNVTKIWHAVFDTMIHICHPNDSFVLTNYLSQNDPEDIAWFEEVQQMAQTKNALFVPVRLSIDVAEHEKRITHCERKNRYKEINPNAPIRYATQDQLITISHPHALNLDVSALSAQDSAHAILAHVRKCASLS